MVGMNHGTGADRMDSGSAHSVSPSPARKDRARGAAPLWMLALAALLVVAVHAAVAGAAEGDVMVLKRETEVHPGRRETCGICAARVQELRGFEGDVLVSPGGNLLLARSWGREAGANKALFVADYSANPAAARKALHSRPERVIVVNNLPTTPAEAEAIFGRPVGGQIAEISNAQTQVSTLWPTARVVNLCGEGKTSAAGLRRILAQTTENDLVVVVTHVERGGIIPLCGGQTSMRLAQLSSYRGRVCALGCNTLPEIGLPAGRIQMGTLGRLTPADAVRSMKLMHAELRIGGTYRNALLKVQNAPFEGRFGLPETVGQMMRDAKTPLIGVLSATLVTVGLNQGEFPTTEK